MTLRLRAAALVVSALAAAASTHAVAGPSYDCRKASLPTERSICASVDLAQLDVLLDQAYRAAMARAREPQRADLRTAQRSWVAARNRCGVQVDCIRQAMQSRLQTLGTSPGPSAPDASTASAAPPNRDAVPTSIADAQPAFDQAHSGIASFQALLELLMAYEPENFRNDGFAIYWEGLKRSTGDPACVQAWREMQNDAGRPERIARARQVLEGDLARLPHPSGPSRLSVAITTPLSNYDPQRQAFPLQRFVTTQGEPIEGSFVAGHAALTFKPPQGRCLMELDETARRLLPGLTLPLSGAEGIDEIPMASAEAKRRLDRAAAGDVTAKRVQLEAVAEVRVSETGLSGRILELRVVDTRDGSVIHKIDPSRFATPAVAGASSDPVAATRNNLLMAALRFQPDLLDDATVLQLTRQFVQREQAGYEQARRTGAAGRMLFVFAREEIEGRSVEFVSPQLAPKMRAFVLRQAEAGPLYLYLDGALGQPRYDHSRQLLGFSFNTSPSAVPPPFVPALRSPTNFSQGVNVRKATVRVQAPLGDLRLEERAIYEARPEFSAPPESDIVGQEILNSINILNDLVALDRVLEIAPIAMPPAAAERVMAQVETGPVPRPIRSRVEFKLEGALPGVGNSGAVLVGHVEAVRILAPDGSEIARLAPEILPVAADRFAEAEATRLAATTSAAQAKEAVERDRVEQPQLAAQAKAQIDEAAAESVKSGAAAALAGRHGPDVVGVQLGMKITEAETIIRGQMDVGWVVTSKAEPIHGLGPGPTFTPIRIFIRRDGMEMITLLDLPPDAAGVVVGIRRQLTVAQDLEDSAIVASLAEKYGSPDRTVGSGSVRWEWGEGLGVCSPPGLAMIPDPKLVEGPAEPSSGWRKPARDQAFRFVFSGIEEAGRRPSLARWAKCGPTLTVDRSGNKLTLALSHNGVLAHLTALTLDRVVKPKATGLKF